MRVKSDEHKYIVPSWTNTHLHKEEAGHDVGAGLL